MKRAFTGLAALLLLAVIAQFYLAASGAYDTAPVEESFQPHRTLGYVILVFALVLTIAAAIARMPRRLVGLAGLVTGLVIGQSVIREVARAVGDASSGGHLVFGLHAINGLVIIGVIGMIVRQSRKITRKPVRTAS
jgi:asparagine N-glycosylation enzyme membrane subunit Stt3